MVFWSTKRTMEDGQFVTGVLDDQKPPCEGQGRSHCQQIIVLEIMPGVR